MGAPCLQVCHGEGMEKGHLTPSRTFCAGGGGWMSCLQSCSVMQEMTCSSWPQLASPCGKPLCTCTGCRIPGCLLHSTGTVTCTAYTVAATAQAETLWLPLLRQRHSRVSKPQHHRVLALWLVLRCHTRQCEVLTMLGASFSTFTSAAARCAARAALCSSLKCGSLWLNMRARWNDG